MAAGHQLLEDLAEHLRVNRDLDVVGRALLDGEVKAAEQLVQDQVDSLIRNDYAGAVVERRLLEEAAIQERNAPDLWLHDRSRDVKIGVARVVQCHEEQQAKANLVEILTGATAVPERFQILAVAVEGEPALALQEIEKHQAVEEGLAEQAAVVIVRQAGDEVHHPIEDIVAGAEEVAGDGLDVIGVTERRANVGAALGLSVDAGDLLRDGAVGLVAADDHAAE